MPDPEVFATQQEDTRHGAGGGASGFAAGDQIAGRYVVDGPLGRGSSGEVLSVKDLSLDRCVAMKVLRGAGGPVIARFMREARLTARIDHPNVPPVHLLEFLPDGGVLFTMRRLEGSSLGEALRRRAAGEAVPALATTNGIVQIIQRVCDALARAHALGIVHRDVKPDNIMLGAHGDVALVDWGECRLLSEPDGGPHGSTVGTPAYMSPEQARGEPADQRSDLYALGATLFHALAGRMPIWDGEPAAFWDRKRAGLLDPLPAEIESGLPRHLLAIARRAMSADPAGRYATAGDLAADLDRFQAGLAVAAYREGTIERLVRWLRRHRGAVAAAAAVLVIALAGAALLWRERQRTLSDWGEPVLSEDFADPSWRGRWADLEPGSWDDRDGELVSKGASGSYLVLRRPLSGAVAIEYDGRFLPQARPGDLSVLWTESPTVLTQTAEQYHNDRARSYWLQAGAYDNHFCSIHRRGTGRLDKSALRLDPGRTYRFRVELDGRRLRMSIDGRLVTESEESLPIGTGHLGLYAYYPGKAFSRVRIYQRQVAELLPATAVGDAFFDQGQYDLARLAYQRAANSLAGTPVAETALYRQGLAARQTGDAAGSEQAWQALASPELRRCAEVHRLDDAFIAGRHLEACAGLARLRSGQEDLRFLARSVWQTWAEFAGNHDWEHTHPEVLTALIETRRQVFAADRGLDEREADLLLRLGRHVEMVERFPEEVLPLREAMLRVGRQAELAKRLGKLWEYDQVALLAGGDLGPLLQDPAIGSYFGKQAHGISGRAALALAHHPDEPFLLVRAYDPDGLLARDPPCEARVSALAGLGRWSEARAVPGTSQLGLLDLLQDRADRTGISHNPEPEFQAWALVAAAAAGDQAGLASLRSDLARWWPDWNRWQAWLIVEPSVLPAAERQALLRARLTAVWGQDKAQAVQRAWHVAGLALGHLDEAALAAMPAAAEAPMWTAIGRALRADLAGDEAGVRAAWTAYRQLPWRQRLSGLLLPHPGLERLARFRSE